MSHIETGVTLPSLDVVAGICSSLNIIADELIFGDKRPSIKKPIAPSAPDEKSTSDELPADIDSFL